MRERPVVGAQDRQYIDKLTGLYNRKFFAEHVKKSLIQLMEKGHPFTLILLDIDDFEYYNQINGFDKGDQVLQQISQLLKQHIRNCDFLIRFGDDMFLLVLTEVIKQGTFVVAERLRKLIEDYNFLGEELQPKGALTISVGMASYPQDGESFDFLLKRADTALCYAKERLKNRVEVFSF